MNYQNFKTKINLEHIKNTNYKKKKYNCRATFSRLTQDLDKKKLNVRKLGSSKTYKESLKLILKQFDKLIKILM